MNMLEIANYKFNFEVLKHSVSPLPPLKPFGILKELRPTRGQGPSISAISLYKPGNKTKFEVN